MLPVSGSRHVLCNFPENNSKPIIAYINITNSTSKAIWNKGIIARRIEFKTTCKPKKTSNYRNTQFNKKELDE